MFGTNSFNAKQMSETIQFSKELEYGIPDKNAQIKGKVLDATLKGVETKNKIEESLYDGLIPTEETKEKRVRLQGARIDNDLEEEEIRKILLKTRRAEAETKLKEAEVKLKEAQDKLKPQD